MPRELKVLLEAAKRVRMSEAEQEEQRRSFAYGNAKIENDLITRETIARQAEALKSEHVGSKR
jgi:hypothetical protein